VVKLYNKNAGGIQEINRLDGVALEIDLWDAIETRYQALHPLRPM